MILPYNQCNRTCGSSGIVENSVRDYDDDLSDQDIWSNDDSVNPHADRDRSQYKQGYLDGLSKGKEQSLQIGFDQAFPKGAGLGFTVGSILAKLKCNDENLFKQAKLELNITKVLNKQHFDNELQLNQHSIIEKWQKIVDNIN